MYDERIEPGDIVQVDIHFNNKTLFKEAIVIQAPVTGNLWILKNVKKTKDTAIPLSLCYVNEGCTVTLLEKGQANI